MYDKISEADMPEITQIACLSRVNEYYVNKFLHEEEIPYRCAVKICKVVGKDPAGVEFNKDKVLTEKTLRSIRMYNELSQRELSALSGVNRRTIIRIEGGDQKMQPATAQKLATCLGCYLEEGNNKLRDWRTRHQISLDRASRLLRYSVSTLSKVEKAGEYSGASSLICYKILLRMSIYDKNYGERCIDMPEYVIVGGK